MSDVTVTTAAPPAAAPTAPAPVATAPAAAPVDDIAAVNAKFDAMSAQLVALLAAQQKPNIVVAAAATTGRASLWALFTTGRAAKCVYKVLDGVKTLLFFGVSAGLGLANELGAIDVTPALSLILPEGSHVSVSQAVILLSTAGIGLRLITKTPAFVKWTTSKFGGGASDSAVDEPKE